ncbi:MAG TPA: DMT family transporter [Bacteroidia bacterium]|jgi:drug/metabolite transporter (DMT)-like permease
MKEHAGELVAFCTTISWSIGIFPFTLAARRLGSNSLNHFRLLLACFFLTLISIVALSGNFQDLFLAPLSEQWMWFGLSGVVGLAMGDYFGFGSFAILGTRLGSVLTTLAPAATLFAGYFLVKERINIIGITGILVTIGGMIWLSLSRSETSNVKDEGHGDLTKGIIFGVLSAVCQGVGVVLANKGFAVESAYHIPAVQATWMRIVSATSVIFLFTIITGKIRSVAKPVLQNPGKANWYALAGTFFGPVFGVSCSMYALDLLHNNPSVAQTIFSLVPIFVIPISIFAYREKISRKAWLGALIAVAGVVILVQRNNIAEKIFHF